MRPYSRVHLMAPEWGSCSLESSQDAVFRQNIPFDDSWLQIKYSGIARLPMFHEVLDVTGETLQTEASGIFYFHREVRYDNLLRPGCEKFILYRNEFQIDHSH